MKKQRKQVDKEKQRKPDDTADTDTEKNNVADDDKPSGVEIVQEDVRNFMESFLQTECCDSV